VGRGFEAYSVSHVEVTAVALEVLRLAGVAPDSEAIRKGLAFIDRMRNPDGLWEAYWWDGQMFATYHCIKAQMDCGAIQGQEEREKLLSRISALQAEDGSWGTQTKGKNIAFETALALKTTLLLDSKACGEKWFEKGVIWLLNYQGVDHAWESGPMMRVPEGTDLKPWEYENWKRDLTNGVGILVRDQNRYFTTATALSALTDYLVCAGDRQLAAYRRKPRSERTNPEAGSDRISNLSGQTLSLRA
jgi:Squalene-hopene cyclase C-terminal domain